MPIRATSCPSSAEDHSTSHPYRSRDVAQADHCPACRLLTAPTPLTGKYGREVRAVRACGAFDDHAISWEADVCSARRAPLSRKSDPRLLAPCILKQLSVSCSLGIDRRHFDGIRGEWFRLNYCGRPAGYLAAFLRQRITGIPRHFWRQCTSNAPQMRFSVDE